ncbi:MULTISPECIES: hypothetical protein [Acinetobacter]|uniref:hypothetical protein n=1 Tax=Acinetobacter TaxID=469 RepID=UPI0009463328|nr:MULTISPECIES: hypothetical protein [Acinetobacter]EKT9890687.1 hypothetical protein [Acinetobacter baumannii]EKT9963514.1 hypothetical protein [Acinetobacter baumannii]EKV4707625.1 hypothetical protein [Acinetobacter baumannii]EKW3630514.1 hypothetical protein [Acinetobacter baumannii]EKW3729343.1 hypothetical protein [Acinetobacter baumannii]
MKVDLKAFGQNAIPDSTPDYIDLEYKNGDMYSICHWDNKIFQIKFPRINSCRITQEGLTLKMQSEMDEYGLNFLSLEEGLDLYKWLNEQNYEYLNDLNLYKYFLISSCEVLEIICGEPLEFVSYNLSI